MNDDVESLYDEITDEIERKLKSDRQIQSIQKKIDKGTATHAETQAYAKRLGEITSKALLNHLDEDSLPDGEMYYNVTKNTVGQTLKDNLGRVNSVGKEIQLEMNIAAGLGIMAMGATINMERWQSLMDDIYHCGELEDARELMGEPIINMTQTYADDLVKENADAQYDSGLAPKLVRTANAGCCEWCAALEGEYDYPVTDDDVWRRHEFCNCQITVYPNGKRNTGFRQPTRTPASTIEARRNYGL